MGEAKGVKACDDMRVHAPALSAWSWKEEAEHGKANRVALLLPQQQMVAKVCYTCPEHPGMHRQHDLPEHILWGEPGGRKGAVGEEMIEGTALDALSKDS